MQAEFTNLDWLSYLASKNSHNIFSLWKLNQDDFFNKYMIIDDEQFLIIANKKTLAINEFSKSKNNFIIKLNKKEEKVRKLFSFKNIDVIRREVV